MDETGGIKGWAILELFGHRKLAGYLTEHVIGGSAMLRLDVPAVGDSAAVTQFYGVSAVYGLTIVSEEIARKAARVHRPEPVSAWEFTSAERETIAEELEEARKRARERIAELRGLPAPRGDVDDDEGDEDGDGFRGDEVIEGHFSGLR